MLKYSLGGICVNDKELLRGKQRYDSLQKEKQRLLSIQKTLSSLKKDQNVIEYSSWYFLMYGDEKKVIFSDEELAKMAFDSFASQTVESNRIYVEIGTYRDSKKTDSIEFIVYKDLETKKDIVLNSLYVGEFKARNKVIESNIENKLDFYEKLRTEFFLYLSTDSQEKAVQKEKSRKPCFSLGKERSADRFFGCQG